MLLRREQPLHSHLCLTPWSPGLLSRTPLPFHSPHPPRGRPRHRTPLAPSARAGWVPALTAAQRAGRGRCQAVPAAARRGAVPQSGGWGRSSGAAFDMAAGGSGGRAGEQRPYELVVFGASGFTGQFVVEEVARAASSGELRGALRWAVAGRSRTKLQEVLEQAAERLGTRRGRGRAAAAPPLGAAEGLGEGPGAAVPAVTASPVRREGGAGARGRRAAVRCGRPGLAGRHGEADAAGAQLRGPGECSPAASPRPFFFKKKVWKRRPRSAVPRPWPTMVPARLEQIKVRELEVR